MQLQARSGATPAGHCQEVFSLDEGDVVLTFPGNLSPESYQDMESFFQLFLRKAKRRVENKQHQDVVSLDVDGTED